MTHDEVLRLEYITRKLDESYAGKVAGKSAVLYGAMRRAYSDGIRDMLRALTEEFVLSDRSQLVPPAADPAQLELPGVLAGGQVASGSEP